MDFKQSDSIRSSDSPTTASSDDRARTDGSRGPACGRRRYLRAMGAVAAGSLLAGCTDDGNGSSPGTDGGSGANSVDDWLSGTGNYDAVEDATGEDAVTVEVGAQGNKGANAFAPAAIEVSPGTTVTWDWVDGYHNVVATDGEFDSGSPERNATFEHTFETPGTVLYYCDPHESIGMKGAVVVAGDGDVENVSDESR